MATKKITTILSIINIVVMSILITDTFLLPVKEAFKICKDKSMERMAGRHTQSGYMEYGVVDAQGKKYYVSKDFCLAISIDEKFIISKTALFGKAVFINFKLNLPAEQEKIGVINNNPISQYGSFLLIAASLLVLLYPKIFKQEIITNRFCQLLSIITAIALFYYFYNQS